MRCHLYVVDHIEHWSVGCLVEDKCRQQHDVYMFNPDEATHCCEMTPSYWMAPAFNTFRLKNGVEDEDQELAGRIDEFVMVQEFEGCYIHCSDIKSLPHFKDKLPAELPAAFVLEWDDDDEVEDLEDFLEGITGNPPV